MAEPLKHHLGPEAIAWLADGLAQAWPGFDRAGFQAACAQGLQDMELKARVTHIGAALGRFLPADFPQAAAILARSLGPVVPATGETGPLALRYFPHDSFIAQFGLDHPQAAFALQEEVTRRATCEFSIRLFLERHPQVSLAQMQAWAASPDPHLRRLASEGMRPRLPWAPRLRAFQRDPAPVIAVLDRLKDDPVRYVQRSVANAINDIAKDHPDLAIDLCADWARDAGPGRRWIIGHAMRLLVKQGHPGALALMGAGGPPSIALAEVSLQPDAPRIGDRLTLSLALTSTAAQDQEILADLVVHYVKAGGRTAPKVFKLKRLTLSPGQRVTLATTLSLAEMTTRRHHPGHHRLDLQVNGRAFPLGGFDLRQG